MARQPTTSSSGKSAKSTAASTSAAQQSQQSTVQQSKPTPAQQAPQQAPPPPQAIGIALEQFNLIATNVGLRTAHFARHQSRPCRRSTQWTVPGLACSAKSTLK